MKKTTYQTKDNSGKIIEEGGILALQGRENMERQCIALFCGF
jgi:hypothetical protein